MQIGMGGCSGRKLKYVKTPTILGLCYSKYILSECGFYTTDMRFSYSTREIFQNIRFIQGLSAVMLRLYLYFSSRDGCSCGLLCGFYKPRG